MKSWLQELDKLNKGHKVKFIKGFIQSLNVVIQLLDKLHKHNIKYLSTRNLCQDPLENFFGRIRSLNKSPDSKQFEENFRRVAFTDLLSPVKLNISKSTNCEEVETEGKIVNMNKSYLEIANLLKKNIILNHIAIDYDEILEFIEEENCLNIIKSEFEYSSAYISGYLVLKLNFLHKNDFNKSIKEMLNHHLRCSYLKKLGTTLNWLEIRNKFLNPKFPRHILDILYLENLAILLINISKILIFNY